MPILLQCLRLLLACGYGLSAFAVADSPLQPLDDIPRTVYAFLMAQHQNRAEPPQIRLQPLDPRLRLPQCRMALEAFLPSGAKNIGNVSVGVRCPDPTWTLYQRATIHIHDRVLVAAHFLRRGTILSAADFSAERRELSALPGGYETDPAQLIGKRLRQALMVGMAISPRTVKIPPAIRRDEIVTVVVNQGGIQVTSKGVALSDAGIGERVRVRNEASGRVVEGTVTEQRVIEVRP